MKIELQALKAKIRGFEAEAASIRKRINKTSGEKRCALWQRKRLLGVYTREHLIAYGLLREIPYEKIEVKANQPINVEAVLEVIHAHVSTWNRSKWTKERVRELLTRPQPTSSTTQVQPATVESVGTCEATTEAPKVTPVTQENPVPAQTGILSRVAGLFR